MKRLLGIGCVLIMAVGPAMGCSTGQQAAPATDQGYTVVYEATGKGKATAVVYLDPPGEKPKTQSSPTLPWKREFKAKKGDYVSVSVTAEPDVDLDTGEVGGAEMTCRITVNGKEMDGRSDALSAICDFTLPLQ